MAKHAVKFAVPERELGRADLTFRVRRNNRLFGTLTVSNGSVVWFPRGKSKGRKFNWADFDRKISGRSSRVEKR